MIAAMCSWHEHHELAANEIDRRLARREKMIVAAPALVEAYAVLTRLPPPHRISPEAAFTLLDNNFVKSVTVIALTAKSYEALLRLAPKKGVAGGRAYDAVIGTCAERGTASTVLTFNAGHFTALGKDFAVVVPGSV
jgi:predicted nucleic acid-binding protein